MSRPFFTRDRLKRIVPTFVKHADHAIQLLVDASTTITTATNPETEAGSIAVDMQDLASKFTLDAATEFLFGGCVHSLNESLPRPWNAPPQQEQSSSSPPIVEKGSPSRSSSQDSFHILPLNHPHGITPTPTPDSAAAAAVSSPTASTPFLPRRPQASSPTTSPTTNPTTPNCRPQTTTTTSFPAAFTSALHTLASRLRSGSLWPLLEIKKDSTREDVKVIHQFVREIVKRAIARRDQRDRKQFGPGQQTTAMVDEKLSSSSPSSSSDEDSGSGDKTMKTLLDHLITVSDDIELIQDELINILIAGRDTTASCITFATYMLSQHPSVSARLEREVLSVLGPSRAPTMDDFRSMPYLRAVINETLRLFPSVPLNVRDSLAERVWTDSTTGQR
ncbi:hypothetical protein FRC16_007862, partial [Serendipita sp. 398]